MVKFNLFIQKWMPFLTPIALVIGIILKDIGTSFLFLVPYLFAVLTFVSSLSLRFRDLKILKTHANVILTVILFLHLVMPLWAYFLSTVIFDDTLLTIGFVISVVAPAGITSVIWVSLTKGNIPLTLAIVLVDTIISPVIVPLTLSFIVGPDVSFNMLDLTLNLIWMIVVPSIIGLFINEFTNWNLQQRFSVQLSIFSKLGLLIVIMINSCAVAPFISALNMEVFSVIIVVFILSASGFAFSMIYSRVFWKNDVAIHSSILFNGGMRNIAVGIIVATTYFPSKVAMPVVFCMLFQQFLASIFMKINTINLRRINISVETK